MSGRPDPGGDGAGSAVGPRARALIAIALVGLGLLAGEARAHLGSTKLIFLEPTAEGATARVDLDPIDVAYAIGAEDPDRPDVEALAARSDELVQWAERVFSMRSDGGACRVQASDDVSIVDVDGLRNARAIRLEVAFECPAPRSGRVFEDGAVFDSDPQHEAIVRIGEHPTVLRVGRQEVAVGEPPGLLDTLGTFFVEGAIHLVTGYDHILFLLSLLLVAGEVAARDGRRKAIRDVALIVTAFTLGHSVTLIAAALDVVTLPSRLVESLIAASIIAVAVWNVVKPEARVGLRLVAAGFGLIHGFGFSSVLRELILPTGERVGALLAFNVGIEVAQLLLVVLVVPLLGWMGEKDWYRGRVVRGGSVLIGLVASWWLIERAFDL